MNFTDVIERLRRSTVQVRIPGDRGGGSGVIWRSGGLLITNAHVARSPSVSVELHDGRAFQAKVSARDARRDLAALQVDARDLPAAAIGNPDALRVGEVVIAVGNPLGVTGAAAAGIVQSRSQGDWVRADVRLAPGNSGGPLANARGEVVGVNAMIVNGLALAVPATAVEAFLAPSGAAARPERGSKVKLGIVYRPVAAGSLVLEVEPHSLADRHGVLIGDVIVNINWGPPLVLDLVRAGRPLRLQARAA
jgi:serine protease Do